VDRLQLQDGRDDAADANNMASSSSSTRSYAIRLEISLRVLDANGNLLDICIAALTAALVDTVIPPWRYNDADGWYYQHITTATKRRVPLKALACALSAVGYHQRDAATNNNTTTTTWLVDPTRAERALGSSVVTVVVDASTGNLIALELTPSADDGSTQQHQYSVAAGVAVTDLHQMIEMARQHAKRLRPLLLLPPSPPSE
jgi:exosome complex RNA-binding protein Rrp42 (RNase PH superfamily)